MENFVIIGLGGAGYTGGIYASRYGLSPLLIGENDGGLITENHLVENFPGYPTPVSGYKIMEDIKAQASSFGSRILQDSVKSILPADPADLSKGYSIQTTFNGTINTRALLLGVGTKKVKLGVKGEAEFFGRGVSYCATCDGFFYKGKTVAVVGGGDSALIEAIYLAGICEKVYLIHRRDSFRGEKLRLDRLLGLSNVELLTNAVVDEVLGEQKVTTIKVLQSHNTHIFSPNNFEEKHIAVDGIFIAIGTIPNQINGLDEYLKRDEKGYIIVDNEMRTNLPGVFAAGDCSTGSGKFRQLITACSEGAIAAESAFRFMSA